MRGMRMQPSQSLPQFREPGFELPCLDQAMTVSRFRNRLVAWQHRGKSKRFFAALQPAFDVPLMNIDPSHAHPADRLYRSGEWISQRGAMVEPLPTVVDARLPFAEITRRDVQKPERPGSPPMIAACFEICQRPLAGLDRVAQPAGPNID